MVGIRSITKSITPLCTLAVLVLHEFVHHGTRALYMMSSATFRVLFCTRLPEVLTGGTGTRLPVHTTTFYPALGVLRTWCGKL